jgi:hypothetical protein
MPWLLCQRCRSARQSSGGCSGSQASVRLLIGTLIVSVKAIRTAAAMAAMIQSSPAGPSGAVSL